YDAIICKMVLHEVRKHEQPAFIESAHRHLKPGGRLVLWDVCLSENIADFYRSVIRAKDELAGFDTMVMRRNFLTEQEIRSLFRSSAFGCLQFVKEISYDFHTRKRLIPEFGGDVNRFEEWNKTIRHLSMSLRPEDLIVLNYHNDGENISFHVRKV